MTRLATRTHLVALRLFLGLTLAGTASADVRLPNVFGDHMVLQRHKAIPIWGYADPGELVSVTLNGHERRTVAADDGKWRVDLPAMDAGGPHRVTVKGNNFVVFDDVLIGEVWVCSGQSNMDWRVHQSNNPEAEIAAANYPQIRSFRAERVVALEPQDDVPGAWTVCSPETVGQYTAVGYYFVRELHKELGVPFGMLHTAWGGTPAEAWTTRETLATDPMLQPIVEKWDRIRESYPERKKKYEEEIAEWKKKAEAAKADGKDVPAKPKPPLDASKHPHYSGGLYNAMIHPLVPYAIRGAIWYQGESNAPRAYQYRTLFPAMIQDWREAWGQGSFPFLFVQLANWQARKPEPGGSYWAELREAQLRTLAWPNTGMAVIIDIGEANDIHPRNKQDVGKRLALAALHKAYGRELVYSSPLYRSHEIKDGKVILTFEHVGEGLKVKTGDALASDGKLEGFAIAGEDKQFVWADAEILEPNKVAVSSSKVSDPVAVRYAWADNPACNLYNSAALPASPFRTDDWPGDTVDNR